MDIYDRAVEYLVQNRFAIPYAYGGIGIYRGSVLFTFVTKTGWPMEVDGGKSCGCVMQVRWRDGKVAQTKHITNLIKNDKSITKHVGEEMSVEDLNTFAKWQRKIDRLLKRKTPLFLTAIPPASGLKYQHTREENLRIEQFKLGFDATEYKNPYKYGSQDWLLWEGGFWQKKEG